MFNFETFLLSREKRSCHNDLKKTFGADFVAVCSTEAVILCFRLLMKSVNFQVLFNSLWNSGNDLRNYRCR